MLFGKKKQKINNQSQAVDSLNRVLEEQKTENPLLAAQVTGKELAANVYEMIKDEKGVSLNTALGVLGSLAGFACLVRAYEENERTFCSSDLETFIAAATTAGEQHYFGNAINAPLIQEQHSVWALSAGMAQALGATKFIDLQELVGHVAKTVGNENFGVPRLPADQRPGDLPINFVRYLWPKLKPVATQFSPQFADLPLSYGFAIQQVMTDGKDAIDPQLALQIVMECAVPMAHIDPAKIDY